MLTQASSTIVQLSVNCYNLFLSERVSSLVIPTYLVIGPEYKAFRYSNCVVQIQKLSHFFLYVNQTLSNTKCLLTTVYLKESIGHRLCGIPY